MSTSPVISVTDELVAELERAAKQARQECCGDVVPTGVERGGQREMMCCGLHAEDDGDVQYFRDAASPDIILALLAERAELKRQNDDLRTLLAEEVISSTILTGFVAGSGGFNIGLQGGACALLAESFGQMLYESDAANYIEATFESEHYKELGQITVTVKRESGQTPHQLRTMADNKCAELKRDADRYRWLRRNHVGASFDWDDNGMCVLAFEIPGHLAISRDTDSTIDAAMQAQQHRQPHADDAAHMEIDTDSIANYKALP